MAIDTDKKKIKELLERGVENVYPSRDYLEARLTSGEQLSLYVGYDPTAPTLHIGHAITLLKLREFQELGHKIIMLIGDFTAMIGDPTDKSATRVKLTREEVLENAKAYKEQASTILDFEGDNPAELKYNSEWLDTLTFVDVLELSSNFTVPQLLERDMFQKRLEEGKTVYLHEFMYPLMQGYDSVAMDVDGEAGGNDQTFNMLAGRTLMKALKDKEKFAIATKILADSTGKKMSKTEGNMIALTDAPEDMFGKVMSWTDEMILPGFELCTTLGLVGTREIAKQLKAGAHPRDMKLRLATEITKTFLGEDAAQQGFDHFSKVIQGSGKPDEIEELSPSAPDIVTVLIEAGFCKSKSDARRTIEGGGVKINDTKVESVEVSVSSGDVIQKGKRFFVKIG